MHTYVLQSSFFSQARGFRIVDQICLQDRIKVCKCKSRINCCLSFFVLFLKKNIMIFDDMLSAFFKMVFFPSGPKVSSF